MNLEESEAHYISSRITFVYKFIIPIGGFVGLVFYFIWALYHNEKLDLLIPLGLFFVALWAVMVVVGVVIVEVKVVGDRIEVINYGNCMSRKLDSVEKISRFLFHFYSVSFKDGSKKIFIPHITEVFLNPLNEPESIKFFKKLVRIKSEY